MGGFEVIRTFSRVEIDGEVCFVLTDEDAIDLAHELSDGMNIASIEAYNAIVSGDAAFKGIKLVVAE